MLRSSERSERRSLEQAGHKRALVQANCGGLLRHNACFAEAWNAIDTDDGKLIAAGGAAAGASLAGLAGLTFLRRRKQSAETSVDSDSGFDS